MRVIIAGGSGLIGRALAELLQSNGDDVAILSRSDSGNGPIWNPEQGELDPGVIDGVDAVVNLAGASIAKLPWTPRRRRAIRDSRVASTRTLVSAMHKLGSPPPVFVSGSASGFYGSRPGERLTERSGPGEGFLADVCEAWETQALRAPESTRTVLARTGVLLHPAAVLKPLITLTNARVSGPLGRGTQQWPWIGFEDEVRALAFAITNENIVGPMNIVGPEPARADDIMFHLAQRLNRPYLLRAPKWALRLALGEAANDLLLVDQLIVPDVLNNAGFKFTTADSDSAIDQVVPAAAR